RSCRSDSGGGDSAGSATCAGTKFPRKGCGGDHIKRGWRMQAWEGEALPEYFDASDPLDIQCAECRAGACRRAVPLNCAITRDVVLRSGYDGVPTSGSPTFGL